jgi:murein DD-endopeptidase MepM/ murein hydrolase activator NlpD
MKNFIKTILTIIACLGVLVACEPEAHAPLVDGPQVEVSTLKTLDSSSVGAMTNQNAKLAASCYSQQSASEIPTLSFPLRDWGQPASKLSFVSILNFGDDWQFLKCGKNWKKHTGNDYVFPLVSGKRTNLKDAPVYAVYDGMVKQIYDAGSGWGYAITIEHTYTYKNAQNKDVTVVFTSNYTHVKQKTFVKSGQSVKKGVLIGNIEDISSKTTNHLHFTLRRGAYSNASNRGALPNSADASKNCDCTDANKRTDPVFPENFINPSSVKFENKQL